MSILYAAYGMNCNKQQMQYRCPKAEALGIIEIPNHQLVFRGHADIEECMGNTMQCLLWEITDDCEKALDQLEGYPLYYEKTFFNYNDNGTVRPVMLYYMTKAFDYHQPDQQYVDMLEQGYWEHGMNLDQIYNAPGLDEKETNGKIN